MRTREEMEAEIRGLQQLLAATDYKALKHADGALTDFLFGFCTSCKSQ